jgi:hypothetical protein
MATLLHLGSLCGPELRDHQSGSEEIYLWEICLLIPEAFLAARNSAGDRGRS